jgi:hypothetical protein
MKKLSTFTLLVIVSATLILIFLMETTKMSTTKIHTLKSLLRVASPDRTRYYFLPPGTTLYYDDSLSEGLDRFYIYVNVEGITLPLQ